MMLRIGIRFFRSHRVMMNVLVMALIAVAVVWLIACQSSDMGRTSPNHVKDRFVLMISGNWSGQLGPCGCSDHQLGGIDRRTHLIDAVEFERRLLIDTGPLIAGDGLQDQFKFEAFLYSMKHLRYDALGLTLREIQMTETLAIDPSDRPLVVATEMPKDIPAWFSVVQAVEKRLTCKAGQLNCLVLAVHGSKNSSVSELDSNEPLSAVEEALSERGIAPEKSSSSHLVIVLVSDDDPELVGKLKALPAVDLVAWRGYSDEPSLVIDTSGGALEVTASELGKYIAQLELPANAAERLNPDQIRFERIAVEEHYPRDPAVVGILEEYYNRLRIENLVADEGKLPRIPLEPGQSFAGNASCRQCHKEIYEKWKTFQHGHAMATLERPDVNRAFDPECVGCHTVGMYYEGGYRSMETTPELANVGCESCHGPGLCHVEHPTSEPYQTPFMMCETCHTHENSPKFEGARDAYFEKIRHWPVPRKYWE